MSRTEIKCFCSYNYRHCYCRSCDEYYGDLGIKNLGFEAEKSYDDDGEFPHQNSAMFAKEACFDSSCVNKPIYKCECGDHSIFMCEIHQPIHSSIKNSKGHVIENLKLIQRKQTLSTKAIKYIQDLEASKLKVIKDTASTMKSFENSCNFLLNNIDQVIEKTKKIIEFIARIDEELYFSGRLTDVTSLEFTKFIGK